VEARRPRRAAGDGRQCRSLLRGRHHQPAKRGEQHALFDLHVRDFNATGMTATELIKIAYNVRGRQVLGGPPWLNQTRYDVVAKPDTPGLPSEDQSRVMVHKLLTERFHLVSHASQQDFPVLALTLDPKAPGPTPSACLTSTTPNPPFSRAWDHLPRNEATDLPSMTSSVGIARSPD
jgi:uncharacterized protein (TIGR03435 family)